MSNDRKSDVDPTASVTAQASHWWITLDAPQATAADQAAFREWVVRSPERIEAVLETARINRLLKSRYARWPDTPPDVLAREVREARADVEHLYEADVSGEMHPSVPGVAGAPQQRSRSSVRVLALAAGVVGIFAGTWLMLNSARHFTTAIGEQRSFALQDGSIVTLNTASEIEVKFDRNRRLIRLLSGEALFQAARDVSRPFDVEAGRTTVRAVGTQFNVYRHSRETIVTVVEGKVAVVSSEAPPKEEVQRNTASRKLSTKVHETYLSAGEQLTVRGKRPPDATKLVDMASVTAWTQRRLVFDHRPIAEIAEEFNRYNPLQIEISGAALRGEKMTAVFNANDSGLFLEFVSKMPGVTIERGDTLIRVSTAAVTESR